MMRNRGNANLRKRTRHVVATATAFTFLCQNFAWAVCADGSTFPPGGFVAGQPPAVPTWSPGMFTATAGSVFVPDNSVFEHNDPAQPVTGGGHNWAFDQGSTTCKETDTGPAGGTPTAWAMPVLSAQGDCLFLPIIRNNIIVSGVFDIPYQGTTITPTCNPALLSQPGAPNPANTRLNQLGCAISHGAATTAQSAATFLFVAGINSGLFSVPLTNVTNPVTGGEAGKIIDPSFPANDYYSDIPQGQKLTNAAVSPDGMFVIATSIRRLPSVWACLNPLGDPGDPSLPIDPNFSIPPASQVKCMSIGANGLPIDLTTAFGPDNQPYFAGRAGASGQSSVNSFNGDPGGSAPAAWPQCISIGFPSLQAAFNAHSGNHCISARANAGFPAARIVQPQAFITHGSYIYVAPLGGTVLQFKVTVDPVSGLSQYIFRTYVSGLSLVTGLGIADDLLSLMVFTDPSAVGAAGQELIFKLPLCEDM